MVSSEVMIPGYLARHTGESLLARAAALEERMSPCRICPRECGARRLEGERGKCRLASQVIVASAHPHFGEEPPLVGTGGSGTIFFSSCNLRCVFCQNADISHSTAGTPVDAEELGGIMLRLQAAGCHNINLVTPTHVVVGIVKALGATRAHASPRSAARREPDGSGGPAGRDREERLGLPLVYNCGGYESVETLRLLEGIVDIYMPDIKYSDDAAAKLLSGVDNYWEHATLALREMHRQVGDLVIDSSGIASRGLIVRHLVMPNRTAGSRLILDFIASEISTDAYVNVMDQYRPAYRAGRIAAIARRSTRREYLEVLEHAFNVGLHRGMREP